MGQSSGAGSPLWFMCPVERKERHLERFYGSRMGYSVGEHVITLTGRKRRYYQPTYTARGVRSDLWSREYTCSCGHHGWSNHKDLATKAGEKVEW